LAPHLGVEAEVPRVEVQVAQAAVEEALRQEQGAQVFRGKEMQEGLVNHRLAVLVEKAAVVAAQAALE